MVIQFQKIWIICFRNFTKNYLFSAAFGGWEKKRYITGMQKALYMVICFLKFLKFSENVIYGNRYIWWSTPENIIYKITHKIYNHKFEISIKW